MKRTSLVCFGAQGSKDSLAYQEIPGRDGGEEFFLFFSPGEAMQEPLLRNLFREAVSASRLGAPAHYFSQFIEQFKALSEGAVTGEEVLSGALLLIEIRRGADTHLLCNRDAVLVHWDADSGQGSPAESIRSFKEVPLNTVRGQRDLFKRAPEDLFVLYHFAIAQGNHTLILVPSGTFIEQHAESLRNSILFPSFEFPQDVGIELAVARSFPALHWKGGEEMETAEPKETSAIRRWRVSAPVAAGALAAAALLLIFCGPLLKDHAQKGAKKPAVLLTASDEVKRDSTKSNSQRNAAVALSQGRHLALSEAWKKRFAAPVTSSPAVYGGMVYFGCRDGSLYAFTADGELAWRYRSTAGIGASPFCASGRVTCANYRGDLFCLDAKTGGVVWSFHTRSKIVSAPAAWEDMIVAGTMDGRLIAVRMKDAKKLWEKKLGLSIRANPAVGKGYIIAATTDGSLVKLDHGGRMIWKVNCGGGITSSPVCLEDKNLIVFGAKDKCIYAYSLSSGSRVWKYVAGAEVSGSPFCGPHALFAGAKSGNCLALDFDGKLLWQRNLGGGVYSRPLLIDETLFVTTYDSRLVALDSANGTTIGEYRAASPIYSSPEHDGERIYFGSNGGVFYALWIHPRTAT